MSRLTKVVFSSHKERKMLDTANLPLAVSVKEASLILPIKSTKIRALIASGAIRSHFIGNKRAIPIAEIHRLANGEIQA